MRPEEAAVRIHRVPAAELHPETARDLVHLVLVPVDGYTSSKLNRKPGVARSDHGGFGGADLRTAGSATSVLRMASRRQKPCRSRND